MPPVKELHYFDAPLDKKRATKIRKKYNLSLRPNIGKKYTSGQLGFLKQRHMIARNADLSVERYGALWKPFKNRVCGDITPAYSTLDEDVIASIAKTYTRTKIIMLVREPISRLWSQAQMFDRKGGGEK
jgi:hypothetical protein